MDIGRLLHSNGVNSSDQVNAVGQQRLAFEPYCDLNSWCKDGGSEGQEDHVEDLDLDSAPTSERDEMAKSG